MAIQRLELVSFRNHDKKEFNFIPGLTVIWGENGSGKTAVLEAIHTLSFGRSFRTHKQRDLIRSCDDTLVVRGGFSINGHTDEVAAQVTKSFGQKLKLNGKILTGRKELIGRNNVVVLSPEEQSVTKGAPLERRQFFDKMFSVTSREYVDLLQTYNRVLKQRNAAIQQVRENRRPTEDIQHWDEQITKTGQALWELRFDFMNDFKTYLQSIIERYDTGIRLELGYLKTAPDIDSYQAMIKESLKKDIALGRTTIGPHRDDISLIWDDRDLRSFGSQGEHKLSLVLLKLAEMVFVREKTGTHPTLLLDDLFAKLDLERSKKIVSLLQGLESESGEPVQTIVTTTDLLNVEQSGLLSGEKENKTYHLER
jgi:DNA replication and repair protein RecF